MTSKALRKEILDLSIQEKIELVQDLWDSIPVEDEALELTPEQLADLEQRIEEANADPDAGSSWDAVRERIRPRRS